MALQGEMICSQFQALVVLKALAQTEDSLYEMMAEQYARPEPAQMSPVPVSRKWGDALEMTEEPLLKIYTNVSDSRWVQ